MTKEIRIAIAGVGNCASALLQGLEYYRSRNAQETAGLIHEEIGGYRLENIRVVAAFDIDKRKVGKPLEDAVFALPNCTKVFSKDLPKYGITVQMSPILDGIPEHMKTYPEDQSFRPADTEPCDVAEILRDSGTEILICYLPVGSDLAVQHFAKACLNTNTALVNCIPVFIASDPQWAKAFTEKNIPIVGDDIKSQFGATIVHRVLTRLLGDRGVKLEKTYQLNTGGNTDFLNMLEQSRLRSKRISKSKSVQSQLDVPLDPNNIHIGPSDYVSWQKDNKVAFIRMEARGFGDVPLNLELRLSVEDSPNNAGVTIDAIRCAKLALDRKIGGPLEEISAVTMKHPPIQIRDSEAMTLLEKWITENKTEKKLDLEETPAVKICI